MKKLIYLVPFSLLIGCSDPIEENNPESLSSESITAPEEEVNPAAEGFNHNDSDSEAIKIADKVMVAGGGRKAWDEAAILKWNFFGARTLTWNKQTGDVRVDMGGGDSTVYLVNLFSKEGKVKIDGEEITVPDSLALHLKDAESIWINDSYWLFMPYKLKDSGVTLNYLGLEESEEPVSYVLQLTFNQVGDTPENMYRVYVDTTTNLITKWAFYSDTTESEPRFTTPWADYQQYGSLILSGDRGKMAITDIAVLDTIDPTVFTTF